jgi:hypothetical protein
MIKTRAKFKRPRGVSFKVRAGNGYTVRAFNFSLGGTPTLREKLVRVGCTTASLLDWRSALRFHLSRFRLGAYCPERAAIIHKMGVEFGLAYDFNDPSEYPEESQRRLRVFYLNILRRLRESGFINKSSMDDFIEFVEDPEQHSENELGDDAPIFSLQSNAFSYGHLTESSKKGW